MASLGGFDIGIGGIPQAAFSSLTMDGDEYVRCTKCGFGGCDVRVSGCGCTLHARCLPLNANGALEACPQCGKPTQGLVLFPMSFREIDEAHKAAVALPAANKNRGRKRKTAPDAEEKGSYISERRTGRWTSEEMALCDKLIAKFETGELPVADGVKLNEFLGAMLKSKQSRLTKKMKNAKLSSKSFQRTTGCLGSLEEARQFSELEDAFFGAVTDQQERAEIKFHMQKEWREQFSRVCGAISQPLDADSWLSSVEEMDRRASQAKDAARMAKRKMMIGVALRTDARNPDTGVFIEKTESETRAALDNQGNGGEENNVESEILAFLNEEKQSAHALDLNGKSSLLHSAPFLSKAIAYVQRHNIPFEHIDLWVPSFVPSGSGEQEPTCRLCYAGSATVEKLAPEDVSKNRAITTEESFNFLAFGDYSQKFSFDVGCGLPGRVYESGRPTWEQSVHNAPHNHFERCGGALQWGIKTVVGIPIASPNVGRIVVTLYSCFDRPKDEELVARLSEEFTRLMPSPKWKLVVDIGEVEETTTVPIANTAAAGITESNHAERKNDAAAVVASSAPAIQAEEQVNPPAVEPAAVAVAAAAAASVAAAAVNAPSPKPERDPRIDAVISLLAEFMPSDAQSSWAPYLPGFMSLRLLLLRQARSLEEEEIVRTMLDSYASYTSGGRQRADIAVMLARDFLFISQQQHQQPPFLSLDGGMMSSSHAMPGQANQGLSLFGLPSTSSSLQNSPALAPIPIPGNSDAMSVVSN